MHRLDKETSGVLLLARNPGALVNLLVQFKERSVQKRYTCLCHGKFVLEESRLDLPVGRKTSDRKAFGVVPEGRKAVTRYQVQQYFSTFNEQRLEADGVSTSDLRLSLYDEGFSLVSCWPKTGRTHQIRVHMKHLKKPIVGDSKYVGKKRAKLDSLWCGRQFLHAASLTFTHPRTGESVTVEAPLSDDLATALAYVEEG